MLGIQDLGRVMLFETSRELQNREAEPAWVWWWQGKGKKNKGGEEAEGDPSLNESASPTKKKKKKKGGEEAEGDASLNESASPTKKKKKKFSSSLLSVNVDREKHLEDDAPDAVKEEEGDVMAEETLPLAIRIRYSMSSTDMQCAATRKSERAMISLLYCKTHQNANIDDGDTAKEKKEKKNSKGSNGSSHKDEENSNNDKLAADDEELTVEERKERLRRSSVTFSDQD
eukprot:3207465-Rhodomonas_salina.4